MRNALLILGGVTYICLMLFGGIYSPIISVIVILILARGHKWGRPPGLRTGPPAGSGARSPRR